MRNAFAKALYDCAVKDKRIYVLAADISPAGPLVQFAKDFPRRFVNVGVSEQAMIGMAAGLALKGMRPFCYTIATFALYRPFEFVRDDLAYQKLPVTVVGMGAGLNYSTLGATHHAMEDVAIASSIPGMQVLVPCDPTETEECVRYCATQHNGPVYLRLGKAGEPNLVLSRSGVTNWTWRFGEPRLIKNGDAESSCVMSYGPACGFGLEVAKILKSPDVFSIHTLKPFPTEHIAELVKRYKRVVVIEEHTPWLSFHVKQIAFDCGATCRIDCFALKDEFISYHGEREELLKLHGLTVEQIVASLQEKAHISQQPRGDRPGDAIPASEPRSLTHASRR